MERRASYELLFDGTAAAAAAIPAVAAALTSSSSPASSPPSVILLTPFPPAPAPAPPTAPPPPTSPVFESFRDPTMDNVWSRVSNPTFECCGVIHNGDSKRWRTP
jgi:hypothetical protein